MSLTIQRGSGAGLPVSDTTAVVKGSSDATKLLRLEVDGFTTGTTRVLTPPDQDGTLAVLERAQTFTLGQVIQTGADANKGLVVKANSGTQSANLQEWQNSAGTVLTLVNSAGRVSIGSSAAPTYPLEVHGETNASAIGPVRLNYLGSSNIGTAVSMQAGSAGPYYSFIATGAGASVGTNKFALFNSNTTYVFQINSLGEAVVGSGATLAPLAQLTTYCRTSSTTGLVVRGAASQSANLQEWQNSAGTVLASVSALGYLRVSGGGGTPSGALYINPADANELRVRFASGTTDTFQFAYNSLVASAADLTTLGNFALVFATNTTERARFTGGGTFQLVGTPAGTTKLIVRGAAAESANLTEWQNSAAAALLSVTAAGSLQFADASNVIAGTSTGTKVGTATTQKLGFWNATPVVQPTGIADADGTLADITTKFNSLLGKLETIGLLAVA